MGWPLAFMTVGLGFCGVLIYVASLIADVKTATKVSSTEYTLTDANRMASDAYDKAEAARLEVYRND